MQRLFLSIIALLPLFMSAQKFAVVDEQAVLEAMPDYVFAEKQIFETSQKYHAEFNRMSVEIDKKFEDYQNLNNQLSTPQAIRERRIQEIQNMQKRAQQFLETAEEEIVRLRTELLDPLKNKVHLTIQEIGISERYTFIFPVGQPLFTGIEVDDITSLVKEKLEIE